jgi:replicative DNA helicase
MVKQALNKNNFGYLGEDFQYQLTKIFIEEPHFFEDTAPIVNQNAFTEVHLRTIVGIIKDYYMENGVVPTYELLRMLLKSKANTQVEAEEADAIINKLMHETSYNGCDWIKDKSIAFFKQQNMVKIAHKILEIAGSGDLDRYPECQKLIDDMSTIGQEEDFGYNIYDMMEKALSNDYTVSIPTGVKQLDDVLGGGLDKGKIGLIIAAAGFGKTTFTTAIASYAATYRCDMNNHNGFKVLQIYFEDDDVDITRKHYSRIIQKEAREFKRLEPMQKEVISDWLLNFKDKDLIK